MGSWFNIVLFHFWIKMFFFCSCHRRSTCEHSKKWRISEWNWAGRTKRWRFEYLSNRQLITRFKFFAQYIVEFMNTEQFHVFFPSKLEQGYPNAGNRGRCLNYGSSWSSNLRCWSTGPRNDWRCAKTWRWCAQNRRRCPNEWRSCLHDWRMCPKEWRIYPREWRRWPKNLQRSPRDRQSAK